MAEAPLTLQIEVFEYQARLAEEANKPLIIHLVKAVDELLKLKQKIQPVKPWIIHGFRTFICLDKQPFRRHYAQRFLLIFLSERKIETMSEIFFCKSRFSTEPVNNPRLFIETDESTAPVDTLYERAAILRKTPLEELRRTIRKNVSEIFFRQ